MIELHHKLTRCDDAHVTLTEPFRKADLVDLSIGLIPCGLSKGYITDVRSAFPNAGFHTCLVGLFLRSVIRHPLNPMPMLRR